MTITPTWTIYESPLGALTVIAGPSGVRSICFPGRSPRLDESARAPLADTVEQLEQYFAGERKDFELSLDLAGTPFQRLVWECLREIPYGSTISYGELAGQVEPAAYPDDLEPYQRVRLAAATVGRTPTPIVVPCHRVIGADGSLTGYGGVCRESRRCSTSSAAALVCPYIRVRISSSSGCSSRETYAKLPGVTPADNTPLSAYQLVARAFGVYRRYPLLFLVLAAGVVVPYELIVLVTTGTGPLSRSSIGLETGFLLFLFEWALVGPLVSALHVHAVGELREGGSPRLVPIAKRGLAVLPVVIAASIIAGLGIGLGLLAFVIPGIVLMLRWYVVAQTAAIEHEGWLPALHRGAQLTDGHYGHVFVFAVYTTVIVSVPSLLAGLGFDGESTTAVSFLTGVIVQIVALSFAALATALLYYDLRARREASSARSLAGRSSVTSDGSPRTNHSLDPRKYTDEERPKGWYVDPSSPDRMRYWGVGDPPGWGGDTRTPRKIKRAWAGESE